MLPISARLRHQPPQKPMRQQEPEPRPALSENGVYVVYALVQPSMMYFCSKSRET